MTIPRSKDPTAMARGYLALVLHAHLPFIRHPEYESFLEETWLFEAITDTYVPLLRVFEQLVVDGVPFRLTPGGGPLGGGPLGGGTWACGNCERIAAW